MYTLSVLPHILTIERIGCKRGLPLSNGIDIMPKTTTTEKPTWAEIHETAKTFLEGLGEDGEHDLFSLSRIEKSHSSGMMKDAKATAMVKNICSFFDNNPFKSRTGVQFTAEMQTTLSNIATLTTAIAELIDSSEHRDSLLSLYLPRQSESRILAGNLQYSGGTEVVQVMLDNVNRNAVAQHKAAAKGGN